MIILLIGAPGSGKGTQGEFLERKLDLPRLVVGDLLRNIIADQKPEASLLNSYLTQGKLLPSDLVNQLISKFIVSKKYKDKFILDGYPRSLAQAQFLDNTTDNSKILAVYFDVQEEEAIKRILGRFSCADCKKIYNKHYDTLKVENICAMCGSSNFVYRSDDNEETIKQRIEEYKKETYPVVEYYRNHQALLVIDANQAQERVSETLISSLLKRV